VGRRCRICILGVSLSFALLLLVGCTSPTGGTSANNAAIVFFEAAAAGDVARAQGVSARPVTDADLTEVRKALFGSDAPLGVGALEVGGGYDQVAGEPLAVEFVILKGYTVGGVLKRPGLDESVKYQVGVRRQGQVWVVVSWTGIHGL
jgi:hypothetical protein